MWTCGLAQARVWGSSLPSRVWQGPLALPCGACSVGLSRVQSPYHPFPLSQGEGPYLPFHSVTSVLTLATAVISSDVIYGLPDALGTCIMEQLMVQFSCYEQCLSLWGHILLRSHMVWFEPLL